VTQTETGGYSTGPNMCCGCAFLSFVVFIVSYVPLLAMPTALSTSRLVRVWNPDSGRGCLWGVWKLLLALWVRVLADAELQHSVFRCEPSGGLHWWRRRFGDERSVQGFHKSSLVHLSNVLGSLHSVALERGACLQLFPSVVALWKK